jgi:hypothetical protein
MLLGAEKSQRRRFAGPGGGAYRLALASQDGRDIGDVFQVKVIICVPFISHGT